MSTASACLYLCADGPLRGEQHDQGPRFVFDGRAVNLGSGVYVLRNGKYRWQAEGETFTEARDTHKRNVLR
jgi:hypothetical protein